MENNKAKLYQKILTVVSKVDNITQSGHNKHQNYHYSTEKDLVGAIRKLLIENKLLILTSSKIDAITKLSKSDGKGGNKESLVTTVTTTHEFIDTETGESKEVTSSGEGWDETDKGSFKAVTGAMKYFISKNFLVATEDDPENDGETKPTNNEPRKSFNRAPAVVAPQKTTVIEETKTVTPPELTVVTAPPPVVLQAPTPPATVVTKPSFGRRTNTVSNTAKPEPKFP